MFHVFSQTHLRSFSLTVALGSLLAMKVLLTACAAPNAGPSEAAAPVPAASTDPTAPTSAAPAGTAAPAAPAAPPAPSAPAGTPDWTTIERELRRAQTQCWTTAQALFPDDPARRREAAQGFHSGMLQVISDKHGLSVEAMAAQLPDAARMLPE